MSTSALSQLLTLYTWFGLAGILAFFMLITRFYQKFSGENMYFRLFLMPMLLFGAAAIRYSSTRRVAHDAFGDLLTVSGGVLLAILCLHVCHRMLKGRTAL